MPVRSAPRFTPHSVRGRPFFFLSPPFSPKSNEHKRLPWVNPTSSRSELLSAGTDLASSGLGTAARVAAPVVSCNDCVTSFLARGCEGAGRRAGNERALKGGCFRVHAPGECLPLGPVLASNKQEIGNPEARLTVHESTDEFIDRSRARPTRAGQRQCYIKGIGTHGHGRLGSEAALSTRS